LAKEAGTKWYAVALRAMARKGGLAQLARALALQARGHRFDSDILHTIEYLRFSIEYLIAVLWMIMIVKDRPDRIRIISNGYFGCIVNIQLKIDNIK